MTALEDRDQGDEQERTMTTIESLKAFLDGALARVSALKNQFAIGNPAWFVAEGERQVPMSEPETFGKWTLRQRWPGRWYLHLSGTETEIDVETRPDIDIDPDAMAVQVETPDGDACYAYPPIAAIERLLCLRRAALATEAQAPGDEPWRPGVASERPGLVRLLEWVRQEDAGEKGLQLDDRDINGYWKHEGRLEAYADCVREIEQEIAALGPSSIAGQGIDDAIRAAEFHRGDFGQGGPESFSDYSRGWRDGLAELRKILRGRELSPSIAETPSRHFLIIGKHIGEPMGCMTEPSAEEFRDAEREDSGCTFRPVDPAECPICGPGSEGQAPSIAEDLRTPEPGAFEGAVLVAPCPVCGNEERGGAGYLLCECPDPEVTARLTREREVGRAAVREALAELREWARVAEREAESSRRSARGGDAEQQHRGRRDGYADTIDALDRFVERFK